MSKTRSNADMANKLAFDSIAAMEAFVPVENNNVAIVGGKLGGIFVYDSSIPLKNDRIDSFSGWIRTYMGKVNMLHTKNYLSYGLFDSWVRSTAFKARENRIPICDGWTMGVEDGVVDNHYVSRLKKKGIRIQRVTGATTGKKVTLVHNMTSKQSSNLIGYNMFTSINIEKSNSFSGEVKLLINTTDNQQQAIVLNEGIYSGGNVIVLEEILSDGLNQFSLMIDEKYNQLSLSISVEFHGLATAADYVDINYVSMGYNDQVDIGDTTKEALYKASYTEGMPRGSVTESGAVSCVAVESSTIPNQVVQYISTDVITPPTMLCYSIKGNDMEMTDKKNNTDIYAMVEATSNKGLVIHNTVTATKGDLFKFHYEVEGAI